MIEQVEGESGLESVVREEDPFEVVVLVHEEAGGERGKCFHKLGPVLVDGLDFDFLGSRDGSVEPGDRQTAFEGGTVWSTAQGELVGNVENDGI